mmetsp:Transcript_68582/g.143202  ORF Transcript_68582/g.143202 Transcript_68582/m.143202 type:complete len:331 (+) Transcript_68582:150-1142(+)|eukprot:CAMPEP_0206469234 /NCGR_PEP_ID=MMETSP0324_2-20121206/30149_1 /ASSEMBLY_ACC=CAM_ASM_000836 /TAXON_ID=2866 /ORGANISM="Crypthecodinium cohnii, Strain Seligo" /LENGTH=330 /DNA_ID=CAMNT_0053942935 /DNA_START=67 /DNA_END=1059 /DNA_ORIENTATION=+
MASLTLRVRHPSGTATLQGVPSECTVEGLRLLISAELGVEPERQVLKVGAPPVALPNDQPNASIKELGCLDRSTLILEEQGAKRKPPPELPLSKRKKGPSQEEDEDEDDEDDEDDDENDDDKSSAEEDDDGDAVPEQRPRQQQQQQQQASRSSLGSRRGRGSSGSGSSDVIREADILPAFDRAIRKAELRSRESGEKHQIWALRKGKAAVLQSLREGNNLSLGALHQLAGVGHWVVDQVKQALEEGNAPLPGRGSAPGPAAKAAAPPTPNSFTWWYVDSKGKAVTFRNDAECIGGSGQEQFRVCILHSSGRMEKAFLPDVKAPPRCPERG